MPLEFPELVADAVVDDRPKICLHRTAAPILEDVEATDRLQQRILDEIGCVVEAPGPSWQTATRPLSKRTPLTPQQRAERVLVAAANPGQQIARRKFGRAA